MNNSEKTSWKNAGYGCIALLVAFAAIKWGVPYSAFFWVPAVVGILAFISYLAKSIPGGGSDNDPNQEEWFDQNNGY